MPLNAGNLDATQGLAGDIFDVLDAQLSPPLEDLDQAQLDEIRDAWRKLAFCIASGVIEHLTRDPSTEPEFAQTISSAAEDATFWNWFSTFAQIFRDWASSAGGVEALRNALTAFFNANPTPTRIRGILQ